MRWIVVVSALLLCFAAAEGSSSAAEMGHSPLPLCFVEFEKAANDKDDYYISVFDRWWEFASTDIRKIERLKTLLGQELAEFEEERCASEPKRLVLEDSA